MAMPVQFNTMVNVYWRARLWQTSVCVHAWLCYGESWMIKVSIRVRQNNAAATFVV
jgi:hypothetical protein